MQYKKIHSIHFEAEYRLTSWYICFFNTQLITLKANSNGKKILSLSILIIHAYMITTGHTIFSHVKAMISGWEEAEVNVTVEDWEQVS